MKYHFLGNTKKDPAPWMMELVSAVEETFSQDAKKDLLTEGCIVLTKR